MTIRRAYAEVELDVTGTAPDGTTTVICEWPRDATGQWYGTATAWCCTEHTGTSWGVSEPDCPAWLQQLAVDHHPREVHHG